MIDKIKELLLRFYDILSNITVEPIEKFFVKLNLDRYFNKEFSKKFIVLAFSAVVILLSAVSLVTVIFERSDKEEITTTAEQTAENSFSYTEANSSIENFKGNFLFVLDCKNSEDIYMIALAKIDTAENKMNITFINKNTVCNAADLDCSFREHYKKGGIKQLMYAVGEYANISIERYVVGNETGLEKFAELMDNITVNIPKKISHSYDGIGYIIEKGEQNLTHPMFLRYFLYLCSKDMSDQIANLMVLMGNKVFSSYDDTVLQKSIDTFTKNFETNISGIDFGTYKNAVRKMASLDEPPSVSIETNFEAFK